MESQPDPNVGGVRPEGRIMAVDALRGFDMFWIVGGGEAVKAFLHLFWNPLPEPLAFQFGHVEWEGFAAWDLIMPLFLFIVGVAMPFSVLRRREKGESLKSIYLHTARRFLILFVLGMIAQGNLLSFSLSKLHFYSNTLQAIACGYLVATIVLLHTRVIAQAAVAVALLVLYWFLLTFVPVPGHGAGVLTPAGNLAMYVDEAILGRFRDGTPYTWILSSITFASTVLLGVMGGSLLRSQLAPRSKALLLLAAGIGGLVLGKLTGLGFPIIKHIWTSSFVLYAAGWSYLLLAAFYAVMDLWGYRKWAFGFVVIGMNAIVAYMLGELFVDVMRSLLHALSGKPGVALEFIEAASVFGLLWLGLYAMYRKRIFVRI